MSLPPRICPKCGEEYMPTVAMCADCGVALGSDGPAAEENVELPPASEMVLVRNAEVVWIEGLAGALDDEGIPSRVELPQGEDDRVQGRGMGAVRCTLYVLPADAERAAQVDSDFARTQVPDLPEDASSDWVVSEHCPACEAEVPSGVGECPDCGLAFVGDQ